MALMKARKLAIAPMINCTDRHFRRLCRILSHEVLLYTEMLTTGAILHGDAKRFLAYDPAEQRLALQLAGNDPQALVACALQAEAAGYAEINLNIGCPSDRVQHGRFGACLMYEPELVGACVSALQEAINLPVTVKTRLGVDERDSYEDLLHFVATVAKAGCQVFILHARKAWLKGLNPKQNRNVPPLNYARVYQLKQDFPELGIVINGGIKTTAEITQHLAHVDGVMIGREAYSNPYLLAQFDQLFFAADRPVISRQAALAAYLPYVVEQLAQGENLYAMTRHLLGLFQGVPGARAWRRYLSEHAYKKDADIHTLQRAAECVMV